MVAEKIYPNSQALRKTILTENKGKMGVYRWVNNINGKSYVGSSKNLGRRLLNYYYPSYLKFSNTIIAKALLKYNHSNFSLEILAYVPHDETLTDVQTNELLLNKEQKFFEILAPEYNTLKKAGNLFGYKHTVEAIVKISEGKKGENHPNFALLQ